MVVESVNSSLITMGGTTLIGFLMGFALRKIIKWAVMILGVLVGVIFIAIQYLHVHGYIADVDWNRLGTHLAAHVQTLAAQIDLTKLAALSKVALSLHNQFS